MQTSSEVCLAKCLRYREFQPVDYSFRYSDSDAGVLDVDMEADLVL